MATNIESLVNTKSTSGTDTSLTNNQHFILIWLDARSNGNDEDCMNTIQQLKRIVGVMNTFADIDSCLEFIAHIENEKIFMIVSGSLGQAIVPHIHEKPEINAIYIFCVDRSKHEEWVKQWPKIKNIFISILPICDEIETAVRQCDQDSVPLSFVSINHQSSTQPAHELDQSFIFTRLLKESLFEIQFNKKKTIKDFSTHCQTLFEKNDKQLNIVRDFERKYNKHKAIWWYTRQCFLYPMLNHSLRVMEVDVIFKMGVYIQDLHHHIEKLHKIQYQGNTPLQPFIIYRGQGLSKIDFDKMKASKRGLISFNGFLSTSKKINIADMYARRAINVFNLMGIIFKIMVDSSNPSTPFALITKYSDYKSTEEEILFSMHAVFRIGEIKQVENHNDQLWEVELTLTSAVDPELHTLNQLIQKEVKNERGCFGLCHFLLNFGKFDKAEEIYRLLLNQPLHTARKGHVHHQLGWIKHSQGDYAGAIKSYEASIDIEKKYFTTFRPPLAITYDSMGLAYDKLGEYKKAQASHDAAITIYRVNSDTDPINLATSLQMNGLIYVKLGDYEKALAYHEEACGIFQHKLPSNNVLLAKSYLNIAEVYDKMDDYTKALKLYYSARKIYESVLPPNHPDLAICYQKIANGLETMGEYERALSFYRKVLEIYGKSLPPYHENLVNCYNSIASVHNKLGDYQAAMSFYQIAHSILEQFLPSNHPDFIILYNNMGETYNNMDDHIEALRFYEKALQLCNRNLLKNDSLLTSMYYRLAKVHYDMCCNEEALYFAEQARENALNIHPVTRHDCEIHSQTLELIKKISI